MAQRESDHARRMRVVAIVGTVVLVLGVAAVLGAIYANTPEPDAPTTTVGGLRTAPNRLGDRRPAVAARRVDRRGEDLRRDRHDELRRHRAHPRRREGAPGGGVVRRAGRAELLPQLAVPPAGDRRVPEGAPVRRPDGHRPGQPGLRLRRRERPQGRGLPAGHRGDGPHQRPEGGQRRPVLPRPRRLHAAGPRWLHRVRHGHVRVGYCRQDRCCRGRPRRDQPRPTGSPPHRSASCGLLSPRRRPDRVRRQAHPPPDDPLAGRSRPVAPAPGRRAARRGPLGVGAVRPGRRRGPRLRHRRRRGARGRLLPGRHARRGPAVLRPQVRRARGVGRPARGAAGQPRRLRQGGRRRPVHPQGARRDHRGGRRRPGTAGHHRAGRGRS